MRLKSTLLAATLTAFAASTVNADEDYPEGDYVWKGEAQTLKNPLEKPAKKTRRHTAKKTAPADNQASVKDAAAKEAQAKEKQEKEGCEKTLTC